MKRRDFLKTSLAASGALATGAGAGVRYAAHGIQGRRGADQVGRGVQQALVAHHPHHTLHTGQRAEAIHLLRGRFHKQGIEQIAGRAGDRDTQVLKGGASRLLALLDDLKPGVTEIIFHASKPTEEFPLVTGSSEARRADLKALTDPRIKQGIEQRGIILTTWRELKQRRDKVAQ